MKTQCAGAAILAATLTLAGSAAAIGQTQQPVAQAQQLFEAGQYEQALKSVGELRARGAAGLPEAFLAAHVALRQNQNDRAKEEFARLTAADDRVWHLVGE
jgi:tetratricopeptide (TPR) repeat protein